MAGPCADSSTAAPRTREQQRGACLLDRHVDTEYRPIRRADETHDGPFRIDDADGNLRGRTEGLANLRPRAVRDPDRFDQNARHLGLRHQCVRAIPRRIPVGSASVIQDEGIQPRELRIGIGTYAGRGCAVHRSRGNETRVVAFDGDHHSRQRGERHRVRRV